MDGDTALHLAVSLNYKTCLSTLLAAGANETIENRLRQTAWQMGDVAL
jgi:ankyrin repeat protein